MKITRANPGDVINTKKEPVLYWAVDTYMSVYSSSNYVSNYETMRDKSIKHMQFVFQEEKQPLGEIFWRDTSVVCYSSGLDDLVVLAGYYEDY